MELSKRQIAARANAAAAIAKDPDVFAKRGRKGGSVKGIAKGFAVMDRDEHLATSSKGGTISKRVRKELDSIRDKDPYE